MKEYKQINYDERVKIANLHQCGMSVPKIAQELGRDRTTIWRELKRNEAPPGQYGPDTAERLALKRKSRDRVLDQNKELRDFVIDKMCSFGWTPEQIAGYLKHRQSQLPSLSHETIYAWIYRKNGKPYKLFKSLPRHKRKRGLRKSKGAGLSRIPHRVSIHDRPVQAISEFGHWEGDLMSFCKNSQHMVVLREKKTGLVLSKRLPNKTAQQTAVAIKALLLKHRNAIKTVTFDNGGEFAQHTLLSKDLGVSTYFCDPYASWQKGGVENSNGRLRRDLPRTTHIWEMSQDDFDEIIFNHNMTPRKKLGWYTPLEAFRENLSRLALHT